MGCGASVVSVGVKPKPVEEVAINGPVDVVGGGAKANNKAPANGKTTPPTMKLNFESLKGLNAGCEDISTGEAFVNIKDFVSSYSEYIGELYDIFAAGENLDDSSGSKRMTYEQYTKVFQVLTVDMEEDELRGNLFEVAGYPDDEEDTASIPPISAGEFATILVRIANNLYIQSNGMGVGIPLVKQFEGFLTERCAAAFSDLKIVQNPSCIRDPSFFTYPSEGFVGTSRKCFIAVKKGEDMLGKIVFELDTNVAPKTSYNFLSLCRGDKGLGELSGVPLTFKNCPFHRIVPGMCIQAGDITDEGGYGGESVYGGEFKDETFELKHDQAGLLSSANQGQNTNTSQFFVTTGETLRDLDGENVVFGRVIEGMDVVRMIEAVPTDEDDVPIERVVIVDCGEM
jgi:cyclophilin family peptidyl-prolyl cis-trans isomerase